MVTCVVNFRPHLRRNVHFSILFPYLLTLVSPNSGQPSPSTISFHAPYFSRPRTASRRADPPSWPTPATFFSAPSPPPNTRKSASGRQLSSTCLVPIVIDEKPP